MKGFGQVILVAAAMLPGPVSAQQWSAQQQEVLQHIQACWDAWATKDFDRWVNACRPADGFTYWSTSEGSPNGLEYWRKTATASSSHVEYVWNDKRPLAIQIDRDVAIVHFYAHFGSVVGGQWMQREQKRMEVFRKVDGRWTLLSGMADPAETLPR